jgi:hypothetical protein
MSIQKLNFKNCSQFLLIVFMLLTYVTSITKKSNLKANAPNFSCVNNPGHNIGTHVCISWNALGLKCTCWTDCLRDNGFGICVDWRYCQSRNFFGNCTD